MNWDVALFFSLPDVSFPGCRRSCQDVSFLWLSCNTEWAVLMEIVQNHLIMGKKMSLVQLWMRYESSPSLEDSSHPPWCHSLPWNTDELIPAACNQVTAFLPVAKKHITSLGNLQIKPSQPCNICSYPAGHNRMRVRMKLDNARINSLYHDPTGKEALEINHLQLHILIACASYLHIEEWALVSLVLRMLPKIPKLSSNWDLKNTHFLHSLSLEIQNSQQRKKGERRGCYPQIYSDLRTLN